MLSEDKLIYLPDDVLLVIWVIIVQMVYQFGFHEALNIQPLLVFEYLERHELFSFMIEALEYNAKTAFS